MARMLAERLNGITVHYTDEGPRDGPALVFSNSLGTDLRLWEQLLPELPPGLRLIRYDTRGHGLTDAPPAPYYMGDLVADAAALIEHLGVQGCVFVGLSIGGMIAQGLAAERGDLLRGVVLSNTAARIGTEAMWDERIAAIRAGGIEAIAEAILERWFPAIWRQQHPRALTLWRHMLCRTPLEGYAGCAAAISGTDLLESTARLALPVLAIAGSDDRSTPPDMVRETADLIAGARFVHIRGAGHLPCVTHPVAYAEHLMAFLKEIGHV